jgi:3-hydroxybutyryl-CoA dehydrogenase
MAIQRIAVIGSGTMGSGIAQVAAQAGYSVQMVDAIQSQVDRGLRTIRQNLDRSVEKGRITDAQRTEALGRIEGSTDLTKAAEADMVIEAVLEDYEVKSTLLARLDEMCLPEAIFATNTSSISITRLAAVTQRPDKVIGMHFFNPVPVMQLVEVIRAIQTSDTTLAQVTELAKTMGKTPVEVEDYPGFVANRLLLPMINEAAFSLMEGVATRESIDTVVKLGLNHPMGPLELADMIGLDVCLNVMNVLYEGFKDDKYRPCPLLVKLVAAGRLGRKTGHGFYDYPKE